MHTQDFETHSFMGKLFLTIGTITGGMTLTAIDNILSILLKLISVASFVCYLLINWPILKDRSKTFIDKIKNLFGKNDGI